MSLFSSYPLGPIILSNRMVMAPMTRCRTGADRVPTDLMAKYYQQRSSAGLIVTEATVISRQGVGYMNTPGIFTPEQIEGWKKITKTVHDAGGKIFLQLWHCGRISHPSFQENGELPVSASAIAPKGSHYTPEGLKPFVAPRALELEEISVIVEEYHQAAKNALAANFDGVEVHGANGYLIDQFLRDGTNHRTDQYGGHPEFRSRFLLEVTRAAIDVWGAERVGVRLSPSGTFNDMSDSNPTKTFSYAIGARDRLGIAYVHLIEADKADLRHGGTEIPTSTFRSLFKNTLIVCGNYDRERAEKVLAEDGADLVAFGRPFISNPDLPKRLETNAPLNPVNEKNLYIGGERGFTDYPALEAR